MLLHSITLRFICVSPERVCERIHAWACNKHVELRVIRKERSGLGSSAAESDARDKIHGLILIRFFFLMFLHKIASRKDQFGSF